MLKEDTTLWENSGVTEKSEENGKTLDPVQCLVSMKALL